VKYNLVIKIVTLNNSKIGMINYEQQEMGHLNYATDLKAMDYAAFAHPCGGEVHHVSSNADLATAMNKAFMSNKPAIINVEIEDMAPLPGKITYDQAIKYGEFMVKNFYENKKVEFPDFREALKRLK